MSENRITRTSVAPQAWVLGTRGMLGLAVRKALADAGHTVSGLSRAHFDAELLDVSALPISKDDIVINCVGLINRRLTNSSEVAFWKINTLWPRLLADKCRAVGAHLIHISTDCVFAGDGAPHSEDAPTSATDLYGRSKALGEPQNALTIRTSIIGPEIDHKYSLLCWLLQQPAHARVNGFENHLWNGMTTLQLGRSICRLIELGLHREQQILHLHSDDTTKFLVLTYINKLLRGDLEIIKTTAASPRDTRLSTLWPKKLLQLDIPPLEAQIANLAPFCSAQGQWLEG